MLQTKGRIRLSHIIRTHRVELWPLLTPWKYTKQEQVWKFGVTLRTASAPLYNKSFPPKFVLLYEPNRVKSSLRVVWADLALNEIR